MTTSLDDYIKSYMNDTEYQKKFIEYLVDENNRLKLEINYYKKMLDESSFVET